MNGSLCRAPRQTAEYRTAPCVEGLTPFANPGRFGQVANQYVGVALMYLYGALIYLALSITFCLLLSRTLHRVGEPMTALPD